MIRKYVTLLSWGTSLQWTKKHVSISSMYMREWTRVFFVHYREVPQDNKVTYFQIIYDIQPQKKDTHRVHITVGGVKLTQYGPVSTPTKYLTTAKLHWNIVLSIPNARYHIVEFKNFYLSNPISNKEYYKIAINIIPQ